MEKTFYDEMELDPNDPNPWQALYLDKSIPFNNRAKMLFLQDAQSKSRQFLLPVIRPFARLCIVLFQLIKLVIPKKFTSPRLLHQILYWGMKTFVSPQANEMILRHFNIGSEILAFIKSNTSVDIEMNPLKPKNLLAVKDNLFLIHDLNLYNFIIRLNKELKEKNIRLQPPEKLNLDNISDDSLGIEPMPNRWTNFLDLTTAIEIFTPVYQLLLTDSDFWRASNSLQLDETIGIYAATILNSPQHLALLNNKHPLVPLSTISAGYRLILHGLSSEELHALLNRKKHAMASGGNDHNGI
ncbi:hypothetical protein EHS13_16945 [Paenibacillus psychroresistens]|uniref:Uncharacterized protein n=1 Tax=Paenibacillus psychroresistens TaxID=1778678 RepID=A0A6B8RJL2_9BACL|nr:hypothetical protein [Paenibacillus psychroresistens]QGQ96450.1 hypothetical protein EHS13_16945 [Paenibacillus psychroresistens]